MSRIVVTGANGFVGHAVCRVLLENGHSVTGLVRRSGGCIPGVTEWVHSDKDFAGLAEAWPAGLEADCIIHLAARVHVMRDDAHDPEAAFRSTNLDGTLRVADAALRHGVMRLVYVSSIKAIAERDSGQPLRETDPAAPEDAYGRSKLAAEEALRRFGDETGLDTVIVRPPLVYGPEVRANFLRLMDAVWKGVPLPLGAIGARRSLVYVGNLADALMRCATDSRARNGCFHIADDDALTVSELLQRVGRHLHKRARLLPVSPRLLSLAGRLAGRSAQVERLTGNLRVDTSRVSATLGWQPPYSTDDGLAATARWYRSMH
jgi:UDP-glucose 4-epimerase